MSRRVRILFAIAAVAALVFALPMSAHAATKYTTRIYGQASTFVVENTTSSTVVSTPTIQGKLQKYSSGAWRNMAGTVRFYRTNSDGSTTYLGSKYIGSGVYFRLSATVRGRYKVYYAGSTSTKSYTKYTTRYDNVVSVMDTPTVEFADDGLNKILTVNQRVDWNDVDYPGLTADLDNYYESYLETETDYDFISFYANRTILRPGTYTHTWTVLAADLKPMWYKSATLDFSDPYIKSVSVYDESNPL